jgi:cold shock CspA family protein
MEERVMQDEDFPVADAIARALYQRRTDVNELAKCVGFLRDLARDELEGELFFKYLDTIVSEDQAVVRSGRTLDYYGAIRDACRQHLMSYKDDPQVMAQILGWAVRLMRYYRVEGQMAERAASRRLPEPRRTATVPTGGRQSGRVKFFHEDRGYGFIIPDDGGDDIFVHKSNLAGGLTVLTEGQQVIYEVGRGRKGPEARNVRLT